MEEAFDPWARATGDARSFGEAHGGVAVRESVLLGAMSALRFADVGATYANSSLVGPPNLRSSISSETTGRDRAPQYGGDGSWPLGSFAFIQGWTSHSAVALRELARRWSTLPPPVTLYVIADEPLPAARITTSSVPPVGGGGGRRVALTQMLQALQTARATDQILRSRKLARFWSSNPALRHAKVAPFPRGVLDVGLWTRKLLSPANRRRQVQRHGRPVRLFCGCLSLRSSHSRRAKLAALMQNGFTCHAPSDSACLGDGVSVYTHALLSSSCGSAHTGTRLCLVSCGFWIYCSNTGLARCRLHRLRSPGAAGTLRLLATGQRRAEPPRLGGARGWGGPSRRLLAHHCRVVALFARGAGSELVDGQPACVGCDMGARAS